MKEDPSKSPVERQQIFVLVSEKTLWKNSCCDLPKSLLIIHNTTEGIALNPREERQLLSWQQYAVQVKYPGPQACSAFVRCQLLQH